jgi:hypothetical protein
VIGLPSARRLSPGEAMKVAEGTVDAIEQARRAALTVDERIEILSKVYKSMVMDTRHLHTPDRTLEDRIKVLREI